MGIKKIQKKTKTISREPKKITPQKIKRVYVRKQEPQMSVEDIRSIIRPMIPKSPRVMSAQEVQSIIDNKISSLPKTPELDIRQDQDGTWITWKDTPILIPQQVLWPKMRSFLQLNDTPDTYYGSALKSVRVNSTATGLEFYTPSSSSVWWQITGTLSNQTDLQAALDAKFTLPSLTNGSVLFSNWTTIAQNNQNFYYDNSLSRFSAYGSLGGELLSNPNFTGSATGWTVGSGYAYSSNTVVHSSNGTSALSQTVSGMSLYREHLCTFVISAWTVGTVTVSCGGITGTAVGANGTYTFRFVPTNTNPLSFTPTNTARFTIDTVSVKQLTWGEIRTGNVSIDGSWGNVYPWTTRAQTFNNSSGNTYTDYNFSGVLRASFWADNAGSINAYSSGWNGFAFYSWSAWFNSATLYSYNYTSYFYHSGNIQANGYGMFGSSVGAGTGAFTTPTSVLQVAWGSSFKVKKLTATGSLDNTATQYILDATNASACSGTPTYSCSHWTNESDCNTRSHHGWGCTWNAGSSCSAFNNEYWMGTCSGTSGCSADTSSCGWAWDESSCTGQNTSYGGSCAWSGSDCSSIGEWSCAWTSGCTANFSDCSVFSGNDSACTAQSGCSSSGNSCPSQPDESSCTGAGCSWDGMSCTGDNSTCSGSYYTGCSGTYYSCTGTFYNGNCSGIYGSGCSGTSSCVGIGNSTDCGNETGCSWISAMNITFPDGETCNSRTYWTLKKGSGTINLLPYSGQTINETSSYTLTDWAHWVYYKDTQDCSIYTEGTCGSHTGCTPNYSNCTWNSGDSTCNGNAACTGIGDQTTCEATTYFSSCSGTEVLSKNWYKFGL